MSSHPFKNSVDVEMSWSRPLKISSNSGMFPRGRPQARGGFDRTTNETERCVRLFGHMGSILPEQPAIHAEWKRLVASLGVSGKAVHDARIAAQMLVGGVSDLLTLNAEDFRRYSGITIWHRATFSMADSSDGKPSWTRFKRA